MEKMSCAETEDTFPNSVEHDCDDECFEDAADHVIVPSEMDLDTAMDETLVALNLFLNNRFAEAKSRLEPWSDRSLYHSLGYATLMYLQAAMTFEMSDIDAAITVVKRSVAICNRHRKKTSMLGSLTKRSFNDMTEDEVHAELCYAECLIERALLTFIQDENLISFVKGSLKVRACYQSYKACAKILQNKQWESPQQKLHFESGVRMGIGIFNLMISLLPTRIMKLLEFVGFSGNKQRGLSELEAGSLLDKSIRGPLCSMMLIGYHTVVTYVLGTADGDIVLAEKLLEPCLQKYPKGALFLFFAGRIEEIKGNVNEAVVKFEESINSQEEWRQFHHLCFWELMWCYSFKGDWLMAMKYAEKLCRESRWSQATYAYQKAAFLMMCDDQTEDTQEHINYLFGEVPKLKQRIAGKSIPIEKFAVKKSKRYLQQNNRLTLPAYELIYVWNGFTIIGKKPELLDPMFSEIEATLQTVMINKERYEFFRDDYCLALLLKGVCLKHRGQQFQAEQCFLEIIEYEKQLKEDKYLLPYSMMELAILYMDQGKVEEARKTVNKAKHNYKGYSLESRLHFRIHAINLRLSAVEANGEELAVENSPVPSPGTNRVEHPTPPLACSSESKDQDTFL